MGTIHGLALRAALPRTLKTWHSVRCCPSRASLAEYSDLCVLHGSLLCCPSRLWLLSQHALLARPHQALRGSAEASFGELVLQVLA